MSYKSLQDCFIFHRKAGRRGKRKTVLSSEDFLDSVRQTIGVSAFNDLLAMQGQVTLMFAIDDTGSMRQEIAAAKKIATSIVDEQRPEPVDYILSPFNDPGNQLWLASCLKTVL
jgi:hypothetical protein